MLKKIIEKSTLVALCTAPYALAENKISWEKGFYRSWSCEILDPSSIYEAPSKMELYTVGRGLEGPRRNYTFEALVVLAFAQATSDPLGERNVIAFSGTLKKDETVSENVFRFETSDEQPLHFQWQGGKGKLRYQGQLGEITCRYLASRTMEYSKRR